MKNRIISRIASGLIFGVLLGSFVHIDQLKRGQMSREEFLMKQGERYDKHFAKPDPIPLVLLVGVAFAGGLFVAYELAAYGISKTLKNPNN